MSPIFVLRPQENHRLPLGFVSAEPLLDGLAGTSQTIAVMRQLVDQSLRDPEFIRFAVERVRHVSGFDDEAKIYAIFEWFRGNIHFVKDPVNKEKLYPPMELLQIRAGDCDDISMGIAATLMAVGIPARFVTVAANNASPEQFSHVYVEAQLEDGRWVPLDAARSDSQFGIEPPYYTRKRWWALADDSYGDLGAYPRFRSHVSGLGLYGAVRRANVMGDAGGVCVYPDGSSDPNSSAGECGSTGGRWVGGASPDQTSSLVATTGAAVSDIIRASAGQPQSPYQAGVIAAGQGKPFDPWASFATPYTPGGPPAGYAGPGAAASISASSNWVLWMMLGIGALLVFGGGGRGPR